MHRKRTKLCIKWIYFINGNSTLYVIVDWFHLLFCQRSVWKKFVSEIKRNKNILYAPFLRLGSTFHGICYTSCGAHLEREIPQMVHQAESIRRPTAPKADALPRIYVSGHFQGAQQA